jgi:hypothetical protein
MAKYVSLRLTRGGVKQDIQELKALAYDGQSANFTVGLVVTGGTSGATGRIVADTDGGAAGTLLLKDVRGVFANNEALTDSSTGAAVVDGILALPSLTPADQMILNIDTELYTKAEAQAAIRNFAQKVTEMRWPTG